MLLEPNDRSRLQALLTALDASPVALQRDLHRGEGRKGDPGIHRAAMTKAATDAWNDKFPATFLQQLASAAGRGCIPTPIFTR